MSLELVGNIAAFVLYLSMMIFIGWRYMKNNESSGDFFLGGRKVGPWMTALSAEASDMSGWLLMGLPGLAYLGGMKEAFWTALGLIIGTYLNWLIVAKPLRRFTVAYRDSITIPEFLTHRFRDRSRIISSVSVVLILIFFTIYVASGFVACAKLFSSVFGLSYHTGLLIGTAVILTYTILGGYLAVCATDFVQGMLMFTALVITVVIMTVALGGPFDAAARVADFGEAALAGSFGEVLKAKFLSNRNYSMLQILSALSWGLGYFGMPHILVRFMGIRSDRDIPLSRRIAMVWVIIAFVCSLLVGMLGTVFLPQILTPAAAETVFSVSIHRIFPAFIAGIFSCAILAAAMSTADSQLLVAASAFSRDLFKGLLKKNASEKQVLHVSRATVCAVAAVGFVLALDENSSVFGLVSYAWAGFGATFGPLILLSLFWRDATAKGAIAGLIAGGITVIVWHNLEGGIFAVYEILPAFLVCLLTAVAVSLLDKNKDPQMLNEFDACRKEKN